MPHDGTYTHAAADATTTAVAAAVSAATSTGGYQHGSAASSVVSAVATAAASTAAASTSHGHGSSSSGTTSAAQSAKQLIYQYINEYPLYLWWAIAATVGAFTAVNVVRLVHQRVRRDRALKLAQAGSEKNEFGARSRKSGAPTLAVGVTLAVGRKLFSWREWCVAIWWRTTAGELFWSCIYTGVVLLFGLIHMPIHNTTAKEQANMVGNRCGVLAYSQIPLIVGLASKNQVISYLTGISYEKLNFLHRSSARACLILSWIHTIARGMVIPLSGHNSISSPDMQWGVVATLSLTLLFLLSIKALLRKVAYEVFLVSHILLAIVFIVACYYHWPRVGYWVWPGGVIWGFDRFARFVNTVFLNKLWLSLRPSSTNPSTVGTVKRISDDALQITIPRSMSWKAGQHVYVYGPTISAFPFEAHPFTISSIPNEDKSAATSDVILIIRARDGFTKRLANVAREAGGSADVTVCVEGPYGYVRGLESYGSVIFVAGGSGVAYTLPLLSQVVRDCKAGRSAVTNVSFIWVVRTSSQVEWIADRLSALIADCPDSLHIDLQVFVTRSASVVPVLNEKASKTSSTDQTPSRASGDISTSSPSSGGTDEKTLIRGAATAGALLFATAVKEGRPDFTSVLKESLDTAGGGAVAINACGPEGMTYDLKRALNSSKGAFSLSDVASGKVGMVDLHVESFGW